MSISKEFWILNNISLDIYALFFKHTHECKNMEIWRQQMALLSFNIFQAFFNNKSHLYDVIYVNVPLFNWKAIVRGWIKKLSVCFYLIFIKNIFFERCAFYFKFPQILHHCFHITYHVVDFITPKLYKCYRRSKSYENFKKIRILII